jgi:hypothetical protein
MPLSGDTANRRKLVRPVGRWIGPPPEVGARLPRPNRDIEVGLTPEVGGPAPRPNHALTHVVTCCKRIFLPFPVVILWHFSVSFSAFRG